MQSLIVEYHCVSTDEGSRFAYGEVLCLIVPYLALGSCPYHILLWCAAVVYDKHQLRAIYHLQIIVDTLKAACLQFRDVASQRTCALGNDIFGTFLTMQVNGDIVGAIEC